MARSTTIWMLVLAMMAALGACSGSDRQDAGGSATDAVQDSATIPAAETEPAAMTEEEALTLCRAAAAELGSRLKAALKAALQEGGPVRALEVCNEKAPGIAAGISERNHVDVGRTSLKWRNPGNAPDAWERQVMERFAADKAAGASNLGLETWEISSVDGRREFRYMKAIPTLPLCLKCHGGNIAPEVAAKIRDLYPEDHATGFDLGDLRGAFTVSLVMPGGEPAGD